MIQKPMLAATIKDVIDLEFPLLATPKLDGIRCIIKEGIPVSRNFKPIPNKFVRQELKGLPDGLDGELMLRQGDFNSVQSAIMSEEGKPDFVYNVFDVYSTKGYQDRVTEAIRLFNLPIPRINIVFPAFVKDLEQLAIFEKTAIEQGYEGVMLRKPDSPYKFGRSTMKEQYLMKLKRFEDSEATIIGFEELMHNDNEATEDLLGHTKRAKKQANMTPAGTLGKLIVKDMKNGIEFGLGTGFTAEMRKTIWENRATYMGKIVNYKYQGIVDKPRFPSFRGFRSKNDL